MPYGPCNLCGATNYSMSMGGPIHLPLCGELLIQLKKITSEDEP